MISNRNVYDAFGRFLPKNRDGKKITLEQETPDGRCYLYWCIIIGWYLEMLVTHEHLSILCSHNGIVPINLIFVFTRLKLLKKTHTQDFSDTFYEGDLSEKYNSELVFVFLST